jgi:hypothetical protein
VEYDVIYISKVIWAILNHSVILNSAHEHTILQLSEIKLI